MDRITWDTPVDALMHSDELQELYHAGVKGMKWGVRKKQPVSSTRSGRKYTAKNSGGRSKSSISSKIKKGRMAAKAAKAKKVAAIISGSAAVASGALWVASAFIPGMPILNTIAAASNLASIATAPK